MHARVTAVLVASNGADHLPRTLEAIAAQTRAPDALVVVDCASSDATSTLLAAAQPTRFISASSRLSFGTAVTHALGVAPPPTSENEWLWLLAHDTAPEPGALAALLAAVEVNPSVAAAGPKQMEWDDGDYISEFGETITRLGASVPLVETELDQAQHERMSDVLGVGAAGMLVRHTVWNEVGGFDPALPTADNGLDFSIRVRLAGHRVMAVPSARVASDGDGFSGPGRSTRGSARRKRQTARRAAQLHRRLVYAPPFAVLFHWLSLVPLAVARSLFQLVRKQPGAIGGEFAAAFKTAFGSKIGEGRRRLKASRRVGWKAIAPLRMPGDEIRRRRSLQREIALTYLRGDRDRIQFIASGGVATVLLVALVGFVIFLPVFGAAAITGGGALPLETTVGGLWSQIGTGFRDLGLGFVGAADPFAAVLAVLGSITFWSPSFAIVCLYLVALPLAALAAWFCAARLTDRPVLRSAAAVLWVLAPSFLGALDAGMIAPIIAHLLLPWLVLAGLAAPKSWSASAMASILFAAVLAVAPSLWPALLILWLVATVAARRDVARLIGIPLPALALFAPLIWDQFQRGTPLALLADPGLPVWRPQVPVIELLMGLPQSGLGGWELLAATVGVSSSVVLLVLAVLTVPLVITALASLVLPGSYRAVVAVVIAILGFGTAVAAGQLSLATSGSNAVSIWPGSGLSLYWLGLVGAAVLGLSSLPKLAGLPAVIASVAVGVIVLPSALGVLLGTADVTPGSGRLLPAYVTAEASNSPRVGTLVLSPQSDGGLGASVVHGAGATLNQQSTLGATADAADADRTELASIVGNAASISGADVSSRLTSLGVEFILLAPATATQSGAAADEIVSRSANALNSNPQLTFIGDTFAGRLWQVSDDGTLASLPDPSPTNTGTPLGILVLVIQGFVFAMALLLALPAGRLQVQGNRAVSATAHVGPADSVEEELATEKGPEYDDDVPVGEEPEALETVEEQDLPPDAAAPVVAGATLAATSLSDAPAAGVDDAPPSDPAATSVETATGIYAAEYVTDAPVADEGEETPAGEQVVSTEQADTESPTPAPTGPVDPEPPVEAEPPVEPEPPVAVEPALSAEPAPAVETDPVDTVEADSAPGAQPEPAAGIEPEPGSLAQPAPIPAMDPDSAVVPTEVGTTAVPVAGADPGAERDAGVDAAPAEPVSLPPASGAPIAPDLDDYDPNDETVLSIRDALDRDAANDAGGDADTDPARLDPKGSDDGR
ncbi:MAG: glycosyltransferase [Herbiconiux sp.]|uniref:glycosyltransferase n=1 Tax=Herbiconiux sp. TaxID=1871186 RepID=UPI0012001327|nr:glycosyltransferase [Herbiconiux sp.]TAJ49329.1 MAG: glycosyltransferase [Herbiconiux sp.]